MGSSGAGRKINTLNGGNYPLDRPHSNRRNTTCPTSSGFPPSSDERADTCVRPVYRCQTKRPKSSTRDPATERAANRQQFTPKEDDRTRFGGGSPTADGRCSYDIPVD